MQTGTIEEKIFQRQAHKKALSSTVVDQNEDCERHFTLSDLRDLFRLEETVSDTHGKFKCARCVNNIQVRPPPDDSDCTSDLSNWFHGWNNRSIADMVLKEIWDIARYISFVFHHKSAQVAVADVKRDEKDEDVDVEDDRVSDEDYED